MSPDLESIDYYERIDVPRLLSLLKIKAKKQGRSWWASCPSGDHVDRHPSWHIRDRPGHSLNASHHCFSCGYSGSAGDLVAKALDLSEPGAWRYIEANALRVPSLDVKVTIAGTSAKPLYCFFPDNFCFDPLEKWITLPRRYAESRGLTPQQVATYRIGYVIDGPYRNRIVIPTYDRKGDMVHWTARAFGDSLPRYLNATKEKHGADPGLAVFGEHLWPERGAVGEDDVLFVLESALNALAVERVYPDDKCYIAAVGGCHLRVPLTEFKNVVILADGDRAGAALADQVENELWRHCRIWRLDFDEGEDPNSTAPEVLRAGLREAVASVRALPAKGVHR